MILNLSRWVPAARAFYNYRHTLPNTSNSQLPTPPLEFELILRLVRDLVAFKEGASDPLEQRRVEHRQDAGENRVSFDKINQAQCKDSLAIFSYHRFSGKIHFQIFLAVADILLRERRFDNNGLQRQNLAQ